MDHPPPHVRTGRLVLYSADSADILVGALAAVLTGDPRGPMEREWMAVPSDGMRRWVALELARHLGSSDADAQDGVAANFDRAYPGSLRAAVLDAADGGQPDPWQIDRMVWYLLSLFENLAGGGELRPFTDLPAGGSRYTRVRAVADLFDRYHLHRPAMIRSWAGGASVDGALGPLPGYAAWQPELWRLLRASVGAPSPPERMDAVLADVASGRVELDLPGRLVFFGFTSLPGRGFLELAQAVAVDRDVLLFLLEPHRFDPAELARSGLVATGDAGRLRSSDRSADLVRQPLLRTWGRLPRETALILAGARASGALRSGSVPDTRSPASETLLARLQADIRQNADAVPKTVSEGDSSVRFHACFGALRQVQVARDAILHLLADPSSGLREEDVLVVCPGLERFAPLVEAAFGAPASRPVDPGPGSGAPRLHYRIADRSIRTANPVLGAVAALLELVAGRFECVELLDFLSLAPVRERFGFDDDDLGVLADWTTATRVRWGLDPGHRSGFGVPASVRTNTWQSALDQLLFGAAIDDSGALLATGGIAPHGVEGGAVEVLGSLAHVLARVAALAEWCVDGERYSLPDWIAVVRSVCADLFASPGGAAWQLEALDRILDDLLAAEDSVGRDPVPTLDLLDLRRLLDGALDGRPGRPDFFRGGVTVTSMTPLRWVPFRVVCVLGLDQEFVGASAPDAADLIAASPQLGDPDRRAEVRQSFLEMILAAQDHLVIVRDGHDLRSNHEVPRAVPAAELFDAVLGLVPENERPDLASRLEIAHPRHGFDERCLLPGTLVEDVAWSFDPAELAGANGRRHRSPRPEPFLTGPLDLPEVDVIELSDLREFLLDPTTWFIRRTVGAQLPRRIEARDSVLPVDPDGLEEYWLGQDLLDARRRGLSDDDWRDLARARGMLPPGVLEAPVVEQLLTEVGELLAEAAHRGLQLGADAVRDVDISLDDHTRLIGTVPLRLGPDTPGPGRIQFTRLKDHHRLEAWLDLMVLASSDPTISWRSLIITRAKSAKAKLQPVDLVPGHVGDSPDAEDLGVLARGALQVAVDLYRLGRREPIPLFAKYSPAVHRSGSANAEWSDYEGRGDASKPAVRLVFGDIDVDELEEIPPAPGDPGAGTGGRAERLARYLWETIDTTARDVT